MRVFFIREFTRFSPGNFFVSKAKITWSRKCTWIHSGYISKTAIKKGDSSKIDESPWSFIRFRLYYNALIRHKVIVKDAVDFIGYINTNYLSKSDFDSIEILGCNTINPYKLSLGTGTT